MPTDSITPEYAPPGSPPAPDTLEPELTPTPDAPVPVTPLGVPPPAQLPERVEFRQDARGRTIAALDGRDLALAEDGRALTLIYGASGNVVTGHYGDIGESEFMYAIFERVEIGRSCTSIGDTAFAFNGSLTSVVIPDSVTSIGNYAFMDCPLTSVVIPDSVTSIGDYAFMRCDMTSVVIPDGVTSIGVGTFSLCDALSSVVIPDSVTSIGSNAFYYCGALTSVIIPDGVTSIGSNAFYECLALASIVIPASVTSIGNYAFSGVAAAAHLYIDTPKAVVDAAASVLSGGPGRVIHLRPAPHTPAGWTEGTGQAVPGDSNVTVAFDWTTWPNPPA